MDTTDVQIRLFGRFVVEGQAGTIEIASRTQRCILARLALRPGEVVSFDSLVDVVWPESPPESAIASLQNQIHRLRKLLGSNVIGSSSRGYVLNVAPNAIDVHLFQEIVKGIPAASSIRDQPGAALASIEEALALWRGDPVSEFAGEHWARGLAVRLVELNRVTQERHVEALMALGRNGEAVIVAEMACDADPLRESTHGLLMRALASTHRIADALRVYDRFRKHMVTETGLEPSPDLVAIERSLIAQANTSHEDEPQRGTPRWMGTAEMASTNLPVRPTSLIGRGSDVAVVRELLGRHRLVTVTAGGGSGKTRLAIVVGEAELTYRPGGVWFVDLTAAASDAEVLGAVAGAVGLNLATGDATSQLIEFFADKEALVTLDNCEHVIDTCANFAERFIASYGSTVLLATSRERLDLEGERVVVLSPLGCDGPDSPGVKLFLDRALALDPRFTLTDSDEATLTTICTRLDGLPLAIELAAARITAMNLAELLAGLDDRFGLLSHRRRGHPHRVLEATLDWSYNLLTPEEQQFLRALGMFIDGFDVDAVAAVTGTTRAQALGVIEALIAKSLVDRNDHDGEVRFRVLETVKAYAENRLVAAGEYADVRDRHFDHFHRLATVHGRIIVGEMRVGLRLRADLANITAAFERAAANGRWTQAGELLQGASSVFDIEFAWLDGLPLLERAIDACAPLDEDLTERMKALHCEWLRLTLDPRMGDRLKDLLSSPVRVVRAHARAEVAFFASLGAPSTDSLVAWAKKAIDRLPAQDLGPVIAVAIDAHLLMARTMEAVVHGDFAAALPFFDAITSEDRYAPMTHTNAVFSTAALLHALAGQPVAAMELVDFGKRLRMPRFADYHAQVVVAVDADDLDRAARHVRVQAELAASGRFIGQVNDSLALFAALHFAEGNGERARDLFSTPNSHRGPMGWIFSVHVARQLGVVEEHRQHIKDWAGYTEEQRADNRARNMGILRAEMAHRGWI